MLRFFVRIIEIREEMVRFDLKYINRFQKRNEIEWNRRDLVLKKEYFDLLAKRKIFHIDNDEAVGYMIGPVNHKIGVGMYLKSTGNTIRFDLAFSPRTYKLWDNIEARIPNLIVTDWDFQEMVYRLRAISQYQHLGIVEDVREARKFGENNRIEFKRDFLSAKKKVLRSVVAFANTHNGNLFLGINDDGSVHGVDDEIGLYQNEDKYLLAITNYLKEKIEPDLTPFPLMKIIHTEGKRVLHIFIQSGNELYCYRDDNGAKRVVVRMNNQSVTIDDPHEIGALYMEKKRKNLFF